MKLATALALLLSLTLLAPADEAPIPREDLEKLGGFEPGTGYYNLHIDVLMVAVPEADALALLPQLRDAEKIEKACEKIQEMLVAQKAKLVGWPSVITKSGNRAVTENIDEVRYAIEFSGPSIQVVPEGAPPPPPAAPVPGVPAAPAAGNPAPKPVPAPKPAEPVPTQAPKEPELRKPPEPNRAVVIDASVFDVVPTTFETKNTGNTLEVEPTLDPRSMMIDMNIAPQHVFFAGMDRTVVETKGTKVVVEQPRFRTNKVQTNLTLKSGKPVLLEQFKSGEHAGFLEFFILRATARPVK